MVPTPSASDSRTSGATSHRITPPDRYISPMGPANPWSPNWRPDPTGHRAIAIRSSRRGALLAGVLLWPLVLLADLTTPGALDADVRQVVLRSQRCRGRAWRCSARGSPQPPSAPGSTRSWRASHWASAPRSPRSRRPSSASRSSRRSRAPGAGVGEALGMTIRLGVLGAAALGAAAGRRGGRLARGRSADGASPDPISRGPSPDRRRGCGPAERHRREPRSPRASPRAVRGRR